ncbi:MAG: substrate-binding domain-containing protein [Thermaceae bacterium]|nr:substrate-binding domain-containing protein [Thermaceae bacterium]
MPVNPKRRTTLRDVAEAAGVSPSTVSNAYNRPDQLSPGLRERVLEVARQLGYSPHPLARGLRRGQVGAVGVLYGDSLSYPFADPVAALFMQGLSSVIEAASLGLLLVPRRTVDDALVRTAAVDGFVVYSLFEHDALVERVLERGLPTVFVDHPGRAGFPAVRVDDLGGAQAAAAHLLGLGHTRLGVVALPLGGADAANLSCCNASRARLQGYEGALPGTGAWMQVLEVAENQPSEGARAARDLLSLKPGPSALLCMSDQLALGVLDAARQMGLRVPEDLSVVGFDDIPEARRTIPALTTVHQPLLEKGVWAGRLLLAQLRQEPLEAPPTLPTHLVLRESSGPFRG